MIKTMVDDLMVQQQIRGPHKKWKHMVAVMCLNLTYRKHVKIILPKLFARYPNPEAYLRGRLATQQRMLKPLVFHDSLIGPWCTTSHIVFGNLLSATLFITTWPTAILPM